MAGLGNIGMTQQQTGTNNPGTNNYSQPTPSWQTQGQNYQTPANNFYQNQGAGGPQNYEQGAFNINPYGYGGMYGGNFNPSQASANMNPSGYTPQQPTGGGFSGQFGGGLYGSEASNFVPQAQNPFVSTPYSLNQGYNGLGSFGAMGGYGGGYSPLGSMMNYYRGAQQATAAPAPTTAPAVNFNQAAGNMVAPASGQSSMCLSKGGKV